MTAPDCLPSGSLLADIASDAGRRPAILDGQESLTFRQLHARALTEAELLRHNRAPSFGLRLIPARSDAAFLVSVFATWLAGYTPVPVSERTVAEAGALIQNLGTREDPGCLPWKAVLRTTGRSRHLLMTHGESPAAPRKANAIGIRAGGTALIAAPLFLNGPFEFAVRQLLLAGTVVLVTQFTPAAWLDAVTATRPTWAFAVPTQLRRLTEQIPLTDLRHSTTSLQTLMFSSQPCDPSLRHQLDSWLGPDQLAEYYGTAEYDGGTRRGRPLLGDVGFRLIPGTQLRVVTDDGHDAGLGNDGWIQGCSTVGSLHHPAGTACPAPGTWSGVGDRGRLTTARTLQLSSVSVPGRAIVGGVKVDLDHVHRTVRSHHSVVDCTVTTTGDPDLGEILHLVVATHDTRLTDADVRRHCAQHLDAAERPREIRIVRELADAS